MARSNEALVDGRSPAPGSPPSGGAPAALESRLRRAIEREEIEVAYQPQADVDHLAIVGFEALARWRGEDGVPISPAEFIPVAEQTGLIIPLGEFVLRMACRQMSAWRGAGVVDVPVSVNLSGTQLVVTDLAERVFAALDDAGLPPASLKLELTETSLLRGTEPVRAALKEMHRAGIRFALDDFGTGYSSLSHLKRFPIDILKVDKSFIEVMVEDPDAAAIVSATIMMAHALKMRVVAEGVETREQLLFLRAYRCDGLQGYFYSPPLFADDVPAFIRGRGQT